MEPLDAAIVVALLIIVIIVGTRSYGVGKSMVGYFLAGKGWVPGC